MINNNDENLKADTQSRRYTGVINNPDKHGITPNSLLDTLKLFNPTYILISIEKGLEKGTLHYHWYFEANPTRWKTVKKRLPMSHFEIARGSRNR